MNERSDVDTRQMENMQQLIDNMPPEKRAAYIQCMKTDAVFKSAIPSAIVAIGAGYLSSSFWPGIKIGKGGMLALGAIGYIIGKVRYMSVCVNTHFPEFIEAVKRETSTRRRYEATDSLLSIEEPKYQESTGFDTYFNYNDNQADMNSNLDDDLSMDKPVNVKPSLTYDELRKRHRQEYYNSNKGERYMYRPPPQPQPRPQRDAELLDDSSFKSDTQENSIWI